MDDDVAAVIVGESGASGKGWSELKDVECRRRHSYIKADEAKVLAAKSNAERDGLPIPPRTPTDQDEAYQCGIFMHAARAHWLVKDQSVDKSIVEECYAAGRSDCIKQGFNLPELSALEYSLMFMQYASYWAIRPKIKPYAVELYLEHDFGKTIPPYLGQYVRSTRLDSVSYHPDIDGYAIDEFKTTYDLGGAHKYYDQRNPQILMQQLIWMRAAPTARPEIKGTMMDIWDKGKNKGTRYMILYNERLVNQYEEWLVRTLRERSHAGNERNFFVCNTFNDAFRSQCKYKERCLRDE